MVDWMEDMSDGELEERMDLVKDVAAGAVQVVEYHMAVGTTVEVHVGIAAVEQKYHMAADIVVEAEVCHKVAVVTNHTPTGRLVALDILVLVEESRMLMDHLSAALPSLASLVECNLVAVHSLVVEDTNLLELVEKACQSVDELPLAP
jgi:hypothetical protein